MLIHDWPQLHKESLPALKHGYCYGVPAVPACVAPV